MARMNYDVLCPLVTDVLSQYPEYTNQQIADHLNTTTVEVADTTQYTIREYFRRYGPDEAMVAALEAAVPTSAKMLVDFGGDGGMDLSTDVARAAMDALETAEVLDATQTANWKAIGRKDVSLAANAGLPTVGEGHVHSARIKLEA